MGAYPSTPLFQEGGTITYNRDGSQSATESFIIAFENHAAYIPKRGVDAHSKFPGLKADYSTVEQLAKGGAKVTTTYTGFVNTTGGTSNSTKTTWGDDGDSIDSNNVDIDREVSIDIQLVSVDIRNHPRFIEFAGYNKATAVNGAIWDNDQRFVEFGPSAPAGLRGVSSYYRPQKTIRVAMSTKEKITMPPTGKLIFIDGERCIVAGTTQTLRGNAWRNEAIAWVVDEASSILYASA